MAYPQPSAHANASTTANAPPPTQSFVFGRQYCAPHTINLRIVRKDKMVVIDAHNNTVFKLKKVLVTLHDRCVLLDAAENSIVTLRNKTLSVHHRWVAFKGESNDLMFSVKRSPKSKNGQVLDVFLAHNTKEEVCDFKVKGSEESCVVCAGEFSYIVAEMHNMDTVQSITVYPNMDYAFIITLIVILSKINSNSETVDLAPFVEGLTFGDHLSVGI